jgi:hypothetical protein
MLSTIRSTMVAMLRGMASLAMGGVILWQVAIRSGPQDCVAYVHVSKPNVLVTVDGSDYHIESLDQTPIVCELAPGRHLLRMCQTGRIVYEQEFTLAKGEEIVLVAWERPNEAPAGGHTPPSDSASVALSPHQRARMRP